MTESLLGELKRTDVVASAQREKKLSPSSAKAQKHRKVSITGIFAQNASMD